MSDPLRDKVYALKCFQLSVVQSRERQQAEQERYSRAAEVPAHLSCLQLKYPNFFFPSEWWPLQPLLILHGNLVLPHRVPEVLFCPCCPVAQVPNPGCGREPHSGLRTRIASNTDWREFRRQITVLVLQPSAECRYHLVLLTLSYQELFGLVWRALVFSL